MAQPATIGSAINQDGGSKLRAKTSGALVVNNDTEGTSAHADLKGYDGCYLLAHVGVSADTLSGSVYIAPTIQEAIEDPGSPGAPLASDWSAVPAAAMRVRQGALSALTVIDDAAEDDVLIEVTLLAGQQAAPRKRFVRWLFDTTGTHTNGTPIGWFIVATNPRVALPTQ